MEYTTLKIMIKYKRKTTEELVKYCEAFYASGKLTKKQYKELMEQLTVEE